MEIEKQSMLRAIGVIGLNTSISTAILWLCCVDSHNKYEIRTAAKFNASTILSIIVSEFIRWTVNRFVFRLDASVKQSTVPGTQNAISAAPESSSMKACKLCGILLAFTVLMYYLLLSSEGSTLEEKFMLSVSLAALTILPIGLFFDPSKILHHTFSAEKVKLIGRAEDWLFNSMMLNASCTMLGALAPSVPFFCYLWPNLSGAPYRGIVYGSTFAHIYITISLAIQAFRERV